jgi:predicted ribonuclease toxin of YeeF-YezG toxin-antitoxin module
MTEAIEQAEDQMTTIAEELEGVDQQKKERLNFLATNDPMFQQLIGYERGLLKQSANGKVPD